MLNQKVADLLNDQINKEMYSAYLYLDFANFYAYSDTQTGRRSPCARQADNRGRRTCGLSNGDGVRPGRQRFRRRCGALCL